MKSLSKLWYGIICILSINTNINAYKTTHYESAHMNEQSQTYTLALLLEHLEECIGKDRLDSIIALNSRNFKINLYYDLVGDFKSIYKQGGNEYFTPEEWNQIFQYFKSLPPAPLPSVSIGRDLKPNEQLNVELLQNLLYNFCSDYGYYLNSINIRYDNHLPNSFISRRLEDLYENRYFPKPDPSLFNQASWNDFKKMYYRELQDSNLISKKWNKEMNSGFKGNRHTHIPEPTYDDMDADGYHWVNVPLNNYAVRIQIPDKSEIKIASDTLSATLSLPDSSYVTLNYTRNLPEPKLYENEINQRLRKINNLEVNDKFILSDGSFIRNQQKIYWERILYRYGVCVTLYTTSKEDLDKYQRYILLPITIELRPKYKTIYLD